jgi:hypothetical protein
MRCLPQGLRLTALAGLERKRGQCRSRASARRWQAKI